jgi:hypothetical protein
VTSNDAPNAPDYSLIRAAIEGLHDFVDGHLDDPDNSRVTAQGALERARDGLAMIRDMLPGEASADMPALPAQGSVGWAERLSDDPEDIGCEHYFPAPEEIGCDPEAFPAARGNCACGMTYQEYDAGMGERIADALEESAARPDAGPWGHLTPSEAGALRVGDRVRLMIDGYENVGTVTRIYQTTDTSVSTALPGPADIDEGTVFEVADVRPDHKSVVTKPLSALTFAYRPQPKA